LARLLSAKVTGCTFIRATATREAVMVLTAGMRRRAWIGFSAACVLGAVISSPVSGPAGATPTPTSVTPATPIRHLVVIVEMGSSFDHDFGTYPVADNGDGTPFTAAAGTPSVNGLTPPLLSSNPNEFNPQRLTPSEALTCDQGHSYHALQLAADSGAMDKFVQSTDADTCAGQPILFGQPGLGMDYYDGNTVTGLWNYAQHFALDDNSFVTTYGSETPGGLNLISGNTANAQAVDPSTNAPVASPVIGSPDVNHVGTVVGDLDPAFDDCSNRSHTSTTPVGELTGSNVGDLLNAGGVTWGWFQGGFAPTGTNGAGFAVCGATHTNIGGSTFTDYMPHLNPFQYYQSTSNPKHLPPTSVAAIGSTDQANHQYDVTDFSAALSNGTLPAVSFISPPSYENGHGGYSDPLDQQRFLADTVNSIVQSTSWPHTAIAVVFPNSDGWYDHQASTIINGSNDSTLDTTMCENATIVLGSANDRCGYGPRVPLLVLSPYAPQNSVSHVATDETSVLRFVEDNWLASTRIADSFDAQAGPLDSPGGLLDFGSTPHLDQLVLDTTTGAVTSDITPTTISGRPPSGGVGEPYDFGFKVAGSPAPTVTKTAGTLPPGLVLGPHGFLHGTPTKAGTYSFTATADNGVNPPASKSVTVVIKPKPSIRIGDANTPEGNSGTHGLSFKVTMSRASTIPVSVQWATADGSATAPSDYIAASGTLTFAPGQTTKPITVLVKGDKIKEPNEVFFVLLHSPVGATIADPNGTGGILNDD
jgi:phospholipase C